MAILLHQGGILALRAHCALLLAIIRRWPSPLVSHRQVITVLSFGIHGEAAATARSFYTRFPPKIPQARPFQTA